ncbi:MAG: hypothetical protein ACFFDH_00155 [Promethearchaeota archaeon]
MTLLQFEATKGLIIMNKNKQDQEIQLDKDSELQGNLQGDAIVPVFDNNKLINDKPKNGDNKKAIQQ